jgi:hypothetical protein
VKGKIVEYRVNMKVTFVLDASRSIGPPAPSVHRAA